RAKLQAKLEKLAAAEAAKHKGTPDAQATPGPVAANPAPATTKGTGSGDGAGNGGVDYGTLDGVPGVATYDQQIQAIVQQAWDPFAGLLDPKHPIQCSIHILIGFDGTIITPEIITESSNASFDSSALAALKKVGKLPPPPLDLKPYFAHKGTVLRFDSRTKDGSMASR
ncbi:MAG TPA: TonB C-terminal domain-containing protein, partial [bacterium]|nr:TonB C-terminal domain-containing protein [bacterium]